MRTIFEKDALLQMEQSICDFLTKKGLLSIDTKDPVELAKSLGFSLYLAKFDEKTDGVIVVNEEKESVGDFSNNKIIAVNSSASKIDKRFIIAHELAHYIKESENNNKVVYAQRDHFTNIRTYDEQKIDYMAAALLMPRAEFANDLEILNDKKAYPYLSNEDKIEKLMEKYVVSYQSVIRRISEIEIMETEA